MIFLTTLFYTEGLFNIQNILGCCEPLIKWWYWLPWKQHFLLFMFNVFQIKVFSEPLLISNLVYVGFHRIPIEIINDFNEHKAHIFILTIVKLSPHHSLYIDKFWYMYIFDICIMFFTVKLSFLFFFVGQNSEVTLHNLFFLASNFLSRVNQDVSR